MRRSRARGRRLAALCSAGVAGLLCSTALSAAPDDGRDLARARVATQCAAFWQGSAQPARAAPFLALARSLGQETSETQRLLAQMRPTMEQLAADRGTSDRAEALWLRHAVLCRPERAPLP